MTATRIVATADVKVGDEITETDTPAGPFYRVTRETAKSLWFTTDDADPIEVRVGKSQRAGVAA